MNIPIHFTDGTQLEYDPHTGRLGTAGIDQPIPVRAGPFQKSRRLHHLKIQLGLSCNYSCDYCSQRFVPHADQTTSAHVEPFLAELDTWYDPAPGSRIAFWGGEPLVYWKTLKPLAEALRARYPALVFSIITNGSLLDEHKIEWLDGMGFLVAISHDGPGQHVRGPDPNWAHVLELYRRLRPQNRVSFNPMLTRGNSSRARIAAYFIELTGDPDVPLGEGSMIDPYDAGGLANLMTPAERLDYRRAAVDELRWGGARNFQVVYQKFKAALGGPHASEIGQKCGIEREDNLTVDLRGNVLTCQNVSVAATAPNGMSHKVGHVSDFNSISLNTITHWSERPNCQRCPVLRLCSGTCTFLQGEMFQAACDSSYTDNVVFLVGAIETATGKRVEYIDAPHLPEERRDIFGLRGYRPKKVIPLKPI